jgi:molybdopterin-guanine dinucleotide biosynthesis protein MobB
MMTHPVQIIGHPGCGKTTLMVELIKALVQRDIRVGSIKHSAHAHELDKPGKDSFCHRKAGAVTGVKAFVTDQPVTPADRDAAAEKQITIFSRADIGLIAQFIVSLHR